MTARVLVAVLRVTSIKEKMKRLVLTLLISLGVLMAGQAQANITETWNNVNNWSMYAADADYSLYADDGQMGSRFIRLRAGNVNRNHIEYMISNFVFMPGVPVSIEFKERTCPTGALWFGCFFYSSEAQYAGVRTADQLNGGLGDATKWAVTVGGNPADGYTATIPLGTIADIKLTYDGVNHYSYYVNGTLTDTVTYTNDPFTTPCYLYLNCACLANPVGGYIDIGQMTITGDTDVYGWIGDAGFCGWTRGSLTSSKAWTSTTGFSQEMGYEYNANRYANAFRDFGGGITSLCSSGASWTFSPASVVEPWLSPDAQPTYGTGDWNAKSPTLPAATTRGATLYVWGTKRDEPSSSTIKVYLYDLTDTLIPDAKIQGGTNSAGLAYGWPATYNIANVNVPFYVKIVGHGATQTLNYTGQYDTPAYAPYAFPAMIKGIVVTYPLDVSQPYYGQAGTAKLGMMFYANGSTVVPCLNWTRK